MPNPSQQQALPKKPNRYVIVGVALAGASIIAVNPAMAFRPDVDSLDIQLTSGEQDIVIDFVRHADTNPPDATELVAGNGLPGAPVSGLPGSLPSGITACSRRPTPRPCSTASSATKLLGSSADLNNG